METTPDFHVSFLEKTVDVLYEEDVYVPQRRWEKVILPLIKELEGLIKADNTDLVKHLKSRIKELESRYFLLDGIVKSAKEVLAKQNPQPHMHDKGLAFEERKLYIAIEEYEKTVGGLTQRAADGGRVCENGHLNPPVADLPFCLTCKAPLG